MHQSRAILVLRPAGLSSGMLDFILLEGWWGNKVKSRLRRFSAVTMQQAVIQQDRRIEIVKPQAQSPKGYGLRVQVAKLQGFAILYGCFRSRSYCCYCYCYCSCSCYCYCYYYYCYYSCCCCTTATVALLLPLLRTPDGAAAVQLLSIYYSTPRSTHTATPTPMPTPTLLLLLLPLPLPPLAGSIVEPDTAKASRQVCRMKAICCLCSCCTSSAPATTTTTTTTATTTTTSAHTPHPGPPPPLPRAALHCPPRLGVKCLATNGATRRRRSPKEATCSELLASPLVFPKRRTRTNCSYRDYTI